MNYIGMKTSNGTIDFYPKYVSAQWPAGTIYIQFPGEAAPADLLGGSWQNVSSQYAGRFFRTTDDVFFRAEGGNAAAFEDPDQTSNTYVCASGTLSNTGNHTHTYICSNICSNCYCSASGSSCYASCILTNYKVGTNAWSHTHSLSWTSMSHSSTETRPINYTVRIWEKL